MLHREPKKDPCTAYTRKHQGRLKDMPSVGVFAAIFDAQGRILCVRQNYGPRKWTLPGGKMEAGESPFETCVREVKEESGYYVEIEHLIGVYSTPYKDDLVISFACRVVRRDEWRPNSEI